MNLVWMEHSGVVGELAIAIWFQWVSYTLSFIPYLCFLKVHSAVVTEFPALLQSQTYWNSRPVVFYEKSVLKFSLLIQENTCANVSLVVKFQISNQLYLKRDSNVGVSLKISKKENLKQLLCNYQTTAPMLKKSIPYSNSTKNYFFVFPICWKFF